MLDVAQTLAPRVGDAEIEFLHVLVGGEFFRRAVEHDAPGLEDIAVVGDIECALRDGETVARSTPSNRMRPPLGRSTPEIMLNSVVLPAPFGPITLQISPDVTSMLTSATACRPPKRLLRLWTLSREVTTATVCAACNA